MKSSVAHTPFFVGESRGGSHQFHSKTNADVAFYLPDVDVGCTTGLDRNYQGLGAVFGKWECDRDNGPEGIERRHSRSVGHSAVRFALPSTDGSPRRELGGVALFGPWSVRRWGDYLTTAGWTRRSIVCGLRGPKFYFERVRGQQFEVLGRANTHALEPAVPVEEYFPRIHPAIGLPDALATAIGFAKFDPVALSASQPQSVWVPPADVLVARIQSLADHAKAPGFLQAAVRRTRTGPGYASDREYLKGIAAGDLLIGDGRLVLHDFVAHWPTMLYSAEICDHLQAIAKEMITCLDCIADADKQAEVRQVFSRLLDQIGGQTGVATLASIGLLRRDPDQAHRASDTGPEYRAGLEKALKRCKKFMTSRERTASRTSRRALEALFIDLPTVLTDAQARVRGRWVELCAFGDVLQAENGTAT